VRNWVTRGTCHFGKKKRKKYTLRFLENSLN
jgi:hypothetical protein